MGGLLCTKGSHCFGIYIISKIEVLNNEFIEPNLTSNRQGELLRNLRSDLIFQLNTKDKSGYKYIELINIEMELKYPINFLERLP